ncbi:MAG: ATP-binding protein [bacterium]|nr:ATP-binding protein [bacterium]
MREGAGRERRIVCANEMEEVGRLAAALDEFGGAHGIPAEAIHDARLAIEEVFSNVVKYAHDDRRRHAVTVAFRLEGDGLVLRVEDDGRPFNPLDLPRPDLAAPPDRRRSGGWGVHIARSVTDSMTYERAGGRNIIVMRKAVPRKAPRTADPR